MLYSNTITALFLKFEGPIEAARDWQAYQLSRM